MKSPQQRRRYTSEQNEFIKSSVMENSHLDWNEFAKVFSENFPEEKPQRTSKQLKNHYSDSLDKSINRSDMEIEDQQFIINFVAKNGKQFKLIGQIFNRNENQIKYEFYRIIVPQLEKQQKNHEESKEIFQDDFDLRVSNDEVFQRYFYESK
jgi:hypothetical protein